MVQHPEQPRSSAAPAGDSKWKADKARVLLGLLGPERFEAFRKGSPDAASLNIDTSSPTDSDVTEWQRNRLIQRFRDRGLLAGEDADDAPVRARAPALDPPSGAPALVARLADNLDDATLMNEHPAVIAHLLKPQSTALRARVLRQLPGAQARAVMRVLKAL
ncbi:hypothetical protein [Rhodophyticola porphyridii]|uniref:hypothetical protein n=1 Tax=Rhodophyticola porphyridii TaxID=1852017 RepID=UPI001B19876F|nr:hypothetical protein [Roseicyclus sp.]MBO6626252.1 hypothetical protein [Roseicyclus sp.]MBO6923572.1 hypothetical protein [Roseicyclus sp.]